MQLDGDGSRAVRGLDKNDLPRKTTKGQETTECFSKILNINPVIKGRTVANMWKQVNIDSRACPCFISLPEISIFQNPHSQLNVLPSLGLGFRAPEKVRGVPSHNERDPHKLMGAAPKFSHGGLGF